MVMVDFSCQSNPSVTLLTNFWIFTTFTGENGVFYLYTDRYEPQNQIQTTRRLLGSWNGQPTYIQIDFWNLNLLTGDSLGLFWAKMSKNGVFYLLVDT